MNIYNKQGIKNINANNKGNNTVQQKDISWSNRILGNDALTHININTITEVLIPNTILENNPSNENSQVDCSSSKSPYQYMPKLSESVIIINKKSSKLNK